MTFPTTMQAIHFAATGGPEVLQPVTRPVPQPGYGQVLIKIAYAGVNRPDAFQRAGLYPPPKGASDVLGLEASGTIAALGPGVSHRHIGDQVCALLPGGGYAHYALAEAGHILPVPKGLDLPMAAGLPEACFTVWSNLFIRARLQAGERLLVHGGTSGIGTIAIQMARAMGVRVFATAGSTEKCDLCCKLGADDALNYQNDDFVPWMTAKGGADVILDMVGGDYLPRNLASLAHDGRLVQIAFLKGARATVNFADLMMRRLTITGSTLRAQSNLAKAHYAAQLEQTVWPLIAQGKIKPVIDSMFDLNKAVNAHERLENPDHMGKILLSI